LENTCVSCHAIAGVSSAAQVGPDLTHFGSRATLGAGVLPNTPEELTRWVKDPQQVKPGVLMPSYRSLSDRELADLVAFLESLK
jgi:cytochrome c oxidase subunit 2